MKAKPPKKVEATSSTNSDVVPKRSKKPASTDKTKKIRAAVKKKMPSKKDVVQAAPAFQKPIEDVEKIPFSEVGMESSSPVPPPPVKPITPVVKVRNRTPLPMPDESQATDSPTAGKSDSSAEPE